MPSLWVLGRTGLLGNKRGQTVKRVFVKQPQGILQPATALSGSEATCLGTIQDPRRKRLLEKGRGGGEGREGGEGNGMRGRERKGE